MLLGRRVAPDESGRKPRAVTPFILSADPDLELRGKLIRSLGSLRDMLPGTFVERKRAFGRPNCPCADGKNLQTQYQISVLADGKPTTFSAPATLVEGR